MMSIITITEISKQIELKETRKKNTGNKIDWKPVECVDYVLPQFTIPEVRSKACTKKSLGKVLAFIDLVKHKRYAHGCTIMPISSTNKRHISISGSQQNFSNLIAFMIKIGLIENESGAYQYNATCKKYNKSKKYRYYYENEQKIISYCKENNINKKVVKNNTYTYSSTKVQIDTFDNNQVRFNSKLHLLKPDNYSMSQFEDYLTDVLYQNYPQFAYYQDKADVINVKHYADNPELAITFTPTFKWSKDNKAVRKIGIRATNQLVSAKKEKDGNDNFTGYYKEDILEQYGFNLEKDVKSSVPRITLSMNVGEWIPEDVDIYEMIYDSYITTKCEIEETSIYDTAVNTFAEVRPAIKQLHMRGYFDKANTLGVHTRLAMAEVKDKDAVDKEMRLYQEAIVKAEGGTLYDSEIFFHESCIYMDVLKELLDSGYKVWQCYDAWYASKDGISQEEYEEYVTNIVAEKAKNYINTILFICKS